jgi:hypothetical protein
MDWQRWSDDASPVAPSPTQWLFMGQLSQNTNPIRFLVVLHMEHHQLDVFVHLNLALMLTYLDLDYWASSTVGASPSIKTCIEHYLLSVQGDVEKELMAADSATLLERSFGTSTLPAWACRVYHNYGHSQKGRDMYLKHCVTNGVIPYKQEFINYGENHLNPCSYAVQLIMVITSDWRNLCNQDFRISLCQDQSLGCSTKVNHTHRITPDMACASTFVTGVKTASVSNVVAPLLNHAFGLDVPSYFFFHCNPAIIHRR